MVLGAVVAAVVAALVVLVLNDDDDSSSTTATTTTPTTAPSTTTPTEPPTTVPPTTTTRRPNLPPPSIPSFGLNVDNCPEGASTTTVEVNYTTRNAEEIQFAIDNEVVQSTTQLEGSEDVGPFPCDGERHTLTMIAISGGLRATHEATVAVSSNTTIVVS